jgi:peptide deformylase
VFASDRVFLAAVLPSSEGKPGVETFINPVLSELSDEKAERWEGCLSFIELMVLVPRHRSLKVEYLNRHGQPKSLTLREFPARVVQHEYDHLDGVLTIDRAPSTAQIVKASELDDLTDDEDDEEDD